MIAIDLLERKPVSNQIVDKFEALIRSGVMKPGDKLPSVRELSQTLMVSPSTVMKAFRELDAQGYTGSAAGIGTYVKPRDQWSGKDEPLTPPEMKAREGIMEMARAGASEEEVLAFAAKSYREAMKRDER